MPKLTPPPVLRSMVISAWLGENELITGGVFGVTPTLRFHCRDVSPRLLATLTSTAFSPIFGTMNIMEEDAPLLAGISSPFKYHLNVRGAWFGSWALTPNGTISPRVRLRSRPSGT